MKLLKWQTLLSTIDIRSISKSLENQFEIPLRNQSQRSFVNAPVEQAITKLKVARSLPNDQNGLLDHLALNNSKSPLCQLQLCIKVVLFQKQKIWDAKSQCTHPDVVSACCKAHHASYKHNLNAGGKAAQTGPGRKSSIAKIYGITVVFWRISDCWCMLMRYPTELLIFRWFL